MNKGRNTKFNAGMMAVSVAVLAIVMVVLIRYTGIQKKEIADQTEYTIAQSAREAADTIDSCVGFALSSIQLTSIGVSNTMTDPVLENPTEILSTYIENSPFSDIEYIRADGMNMTSAGEAFDASEREYYIQGMAGNTGIWINFNPKYSNEPLLNFYTPLYYNGEIAGVITGTILANTNITPLFMSEYMNQKVVGILVDENNQIIASTEPFEKGAVIDWDSSNISERNKNTFLNAIDEATGEAFAFEGDLGALVGAVSSVEATGWKVIQIVPYYSLNELMKESNNEAIFAVGIILLVSVMLFALLFLDSRRVNKAMLDKAESERDEQYAILSSMADIYYSMHLVNLVENTVFEYSSRNEVKELVNKNTDAIKMMTDVMHATITDEYLKEALEFSDLTTLADRMQGKKTTYIELLGKHVGWIRFSFISIETDAEQKPTKVIVTVQIIDDDKRKEEKLIHKSNTDEMTGLFNRRAYEDDLKAYPDFPIEENFVYVSLDVNELKIINDTYGHAAGDELIKGAVDCMKQCMGNYGRIYRTGGDEFVAMIFADEQHLEEIKKDFDYTVLNWRGKLVESVAVSAGYVARREFPDSTVSEIAKIADKRMYEAKTLYYSSKGVDRRGQAAAHTALCELYTKILKINITEDTHKIINMDEAERNASMGFSGKISEWFKGFAVNGVHEDDVEEFLRKTDFGYLRSFFKSGKTDLVIRYRRAVGNEFKEVMMEMIPANDYSDENQTLFLYVKTID